MQAPGGIDRGPRRKVLIRARMRANGPPADICIRDVSRRGMLLQSHAPPPRGTYVEIAQAGLPIVGQVVWSKERRFGISTRDIIDVAALIDDGKPIEDDKIVETSRDDRLLAAYRDRGHTYDSSRSSGNTMQFAFIVALCACAAAGIAIGLHEGFSVALGNVTAHL